MSIKIGGQLVIDDDQNITADDIAGNTITINELATIAKEINHHPDIELSEYKKLKITSTTHKTGTLTNRDIELALRLEIFLKDEKNGTY